MRIVQLIARKRAGGELDADEIRYLIDGTVSGAVPDYQLAAFLMAVCCRGMSFRETVDLTAAMAHSGATLDLGEFSPPAVDKHSTGGVGDKTTLVVAPLVAACGVPVAKMSGHCLGFSGGTLDKLQSIPGLRTALSKKEFVDLLRRVGLVIAGQSPDLAPADGRLYALRDQTATVDCIPLIASSVLSKKIAAGAKVIVLDVKVGSGAFTKSIEDASKLARMLVDIGHVLERSITAVISGMEQPLGRAVGNALEIREAIDALRGNGPADLLELSFSLGAELLVGAGVADSKEDATRKLEEALGAGRAFDKLVEFVDAQGGHPEVILEPGRLPRAPVVRPVLSPTSGFVARIDAEKLGWVVVSLGGGRTAKGQEIDHTVGLELRAKVGDFVAAGSPLLTVHARGDGDWAEAARRAISAYDFAAEPVDKPALIKAIITWPPL